ISEKPAAGLNVYTIVLRIPSASQMYGETCGSVDTATPGWGQDASGRNTCAGGPLRLDTQPWGNERKQSTSACKKPELLPLVSYTWTVTRWSPITTPPVEKAIKRSSLRPSPLYSTGTMTASLPFENHTLGGAVVAPPSVKG